MLLFGLAGDIGAVVRSHLNDSVNVKHSPARPKISPLSARPLHVYTSTRHQVSVDATGILGETQVPTLDDSDNPIMQGMGAIRGLQEDCEWLFSRPEHA